MAKADVKILVVEDDEQFRRMLLRVLHRAGYSVTETTNGLEGMNALQEKDFHLVLTDIVMPEMEGLETITQIRSKNQELKIIAMSGGGRFSPDNYLTLASQLGANAVLPKPFSSQDLLSRIEELVQA